MIRHIAIGERLLVLGCLLTCLAVGPALALEPAVPSGYGLTWSDEFNGTTLDSTWSVWPAGSGRSYSVGGGNLTFSVYTGGGYDNGASITNSYQQTYGYYVARIKLQNKSGVVSALWMQSPAIDDGIGNPTLYGTEMDLFEHRNYDATINNDTYTTVHWDGYGADAKAVAKEYHGVSIGDGNYHLFAMLWTPTAYKFYVDNRLYWTFTQAISQRPEFLILDSEFSSWGGPRPAEGYGPLGSPLNAVMTVDYVRAYATPEPGTLVLLFTGLLGLLVYCWRKRK